MVELTPKEYEYFLKTLEYRPPDRLGPVGVIVSLVFDNEANGNVVKFKCNRKEVRVVYLDVPNNVHKFNMLSNE